MVPECFYIRGLDITALDKTFLVTKPVFLWTQPKTKSGILSTTHLNYRTKYHQGPKKFTSYFGGTTTVTFKPTESKFLTAPPVFTLKISHTCLRICLYSTLVTVIMIDTSDRHKEKIQYWSTIKPNKKIQRQ